MSIPNSLVTGSGRFAVRSARAYRDRLPRIRVYSPRGARTVYYLTPDYAKPSGGVRVMYRHVDALNAEGIDAAVLHTRRDFKCTWFDHDTRITDTSRSRIGIDDILVLPEVYGGILPHLPRGLSHVILNQGPHLTFRRYGAKVLHHCATSVNLVAMLTVSQHSAKLLRYAFPDVEVRLVQPGLDRNIFHPGQSPTGRVITYMPRRGGDDAALVLGLLEARGVLHGWDVRALDGLSQQRTAQELRASSIFLHFTYQEGFGLPAAEAMACGNLVVGFDGFGGREFFLPDLSRPVPAGDAVAFAEAVEDVLAREERQPGWTRSLGLAASSHVLSAYKLERERADVVEFFAEVLRPPRQSAQHRASALAESRF